MLGNLLFTLVFNAAIFFGLRACGVGLKLGPWIIGSVIGFTLAQAAMHLL